MTILIKIVIINSVVTHGDVAHLGERLNGIQEVRGSIPLISTKCNNNIDTMKSPLYKGFSGFSGEIVVS